MNQNFSNDIIEILGVPVATFSMEETAAVIKKQIDAHKNGEKSVKPWLIATANAEMIMKAQQDAEFKAILNAADLVVADGAGTVWAARQLAGKVIERVAGFDLVQEVLKISAENQYRVFFFGSAPGVAEKATEKAAALYRGINIAGCRNGYFQESDEKNIIDEINGAKTDFLVCALGSPKQERWLQKYLPSLNVACAIGVGGTLDVMAGNVKRAPLWMQKNKLEWLYRVLKEPRRIFRLAALPRFVLAVLSARRSEQ